MSADEENLTDHEYDVLLAVHEQKCFVHVSATLCNLGDGGYLKLGDPEGPHGCPWHATLAGREVIRVRKRLAEAMHEFARYVERNGQVPTIKVDGVFADPVLVAAVRMTKEQDRGAMTYACAGDDEPSKYALACERLANAIVDQVKP